jgi:phosphoribosylglycinamide formyltransferase-1
VEKIAILISGRGSNMRALIEAAKAGRLGADVGVVISNRLEAEGIEYAKRAGIETLVMPHGEHATREQYDDALAARLRTRGVTFVCLAGFMRLVSRVLCEAFPHALVNIHPSLLPAFPGRDAQRQALEQRATVTGATVHLVTPELDAGPIVLQAEVPVEPDDTVQTLSARILAAEHVLYPEAVRRLLTTSWRVEQGRVVWNTTAQR